MNGSRENLLKTYYYETLHACFLSQNIDLPELSKDKKGHTERIHKLIYNLWRIILPDDQE